MRAKYLSYRIKSELIESLRSQAKIEDRSIRSLIEKIVLAYLSKTLSIFNGNEVDHEKQ